ncbi:MAG: hypothetical protein MI745_07340 [Pseudomonadales bacterium]|nr:hypothetical protein [Pseudomonadales bacterium]
MRWSWRFWLSAVVCSVTLVAAIHFLVLDRLGVPDSGIRVRQVSADESGKDWVISLYEEQERRQWRASGDGYRVQIERQGEDVFVLDIALPHGADAQRHRIRQQVRLAEGATLVAAFGADGDAAGDTRVIVDRVK